VKLPGEIQLLVAALFGSSFTPLVVTSVLTEQYPPTHTRSILQLHLWAALPRNSKTSRPFRAGLEQTRFWVEYPT